MSRTDKDMPYWVTTTSRWEPMHYRCQHTIWRRRDCDLPPEPVRQRYVFVRRSCHWWPTFDDRHRWYGPPPGWFINHVWDGTERLAARVDCRNAVKEYRATGEVDTVPTTRQHRHGATWYWN